MQYESHEEYVEPRIETDFSAMDISEYILSLPEPERSICRAVVLEGRKVSHVARIFKVSRERIGRIMRNALRPLAEDFDIVLVRQKTTKVTDDGSDPTGCRQGGTPRGGRGGGRRVLPGAESRIDYRGSSRKITHTFFPRPRNPNPNPCQPHPPACTGGAQKKNVIHNRKKDDF